MPPLVLIDTDVRQMLVPSNTTLIVPRQQEWVIQSITVLPAYRYVPPGAGDRDVTKFGKLVVSVQGRVLYTANIVTLMDQYWGRYTLTPTLPDQIAQLEKAQHTILSAPYVAEMATAIEAARFALMNYLALASPLLHIPLIIQEKASITLHCTYPGAESLLIELIVIIKTTKL